MGRPQDQDRTAIAHDVRAGATDTFIMDKYELSREELYSFYDDMVKEGRLAMSDLLGDLPPAPEPGLMLVEECPVCGSHNLVDAERCSSCGSTLPRHDLKHSDERPSTAKPYPANADLNLPKDAPAEGTTETNTDVQVHQEEEVLLDEDATVDLDTVLDDFAGIGTAARPGTEQDEPGSWAVVTSGIDILDIIESIPVGSDETAHRPTTDVENTTDSVTARTELSLDELLDLASEFDKTGEWDSEVEGSAAEPQQLDLDLDRTIALVHRENLFRKKKRSPNEGRTASAEAEVTVDGLVTLSSEIEVPDSEQPISSDNAGETPLGLQSSPVAEPQPEREFPEWTGGSDIEPEKRIDDVDLGFLEMSGESADSISSSSEDFTQEKATLFEPTIRLDSSGDFGSGTYDGAASTEGLLPDDDVDLDFTLVSDIKAPLPAKTRAVSVVEEPEQSVEPPAPAESAFTFNLDDDEDEPAAEQVSEPKETAAPVAPVLANVRDTQLLETQPLSVFEEEPASHADSPPLPEPEERSGRLRIIAAASVLLILVSLGGIGFYSGYLTVPDGLWSDLPVIGRSEKGTPPISKDVRRAEVERQIPPAKQKPPQPETVRQETVKSPLPKAAPDKGEEMAALPPESLGGESVRLPSRRGKAPPTKSAVGKKRDPGALPPVGSAADLVEAVRNNNAGRVIQLLDRGSDINGRDSHAVTPLMDAAENGNESLVELLLKRGANPNAKDDKGNTALMLAAGRGHVATVKALLNGGADPKEVNEKGQTALARLYASGPTLFVPVRACREIVTLIKEHGERQAMAKGRQ